MVELYQDTLVDLLLPKNAKRPKLEIKKDSKVTFSAFIQCFVRLRNVFLIILSHVYLLLYFTVN